MQTVRVRIAADEQEAKRIYGVIEQAFEDEGNPVTVYEFTPDGKTWAVEILMFGMEPEEAIAELLATVGPDAFDAVPQAELLEDLNWVEKSLEGLAPVAAGRFLIHGSHDRDKLRSGMIGIEIEAALAFGTGHHGTTEGCLREIDRLVGRWRFDRILDLGTGTGVLAIAAAKLARQVVVATDIDPVATQTAQQNAVLNEVPHLIRTFTAAGVEDRRFAEFGPFDLVIANILARPLMQMAKSISARMTADATLILSGLRVEDGPRILFAYGTQGFRLARRWEKNGWITLTLVRGGVHAD